MLALDLLANEGEPKKFAAGETVFHEGDEGKLMYMVIDGAVKLSVTGRFLEKVVRGGIFGEMALIDKLPRSATAIAVTNCTVVPVNSERFKALIRETPEFALQIMGIMAARLRAMDSHL